MNSDSKVVEGQIGIADDDMSLGDVPLGGIDASDLLGDVVSQAGEVGDASYDEASDDDDELKRGSITPKIKDEDDDEELDDEEEEENNEQDPISNVEEEEDKNEPYIPQTHNIVIPSYAAWFSLSKIHDIEKDSLPEFFTNKNPSKTPKLYVKYRNFLINSYRLNPNDYLTVTAARRSLIGDVGTILRLHRFLSKWGLINYQVDAQFKPKAVEPPYTGDYNVSYDAPRGLFPFEPYKPPLENNKIEKLKEIVNKSDDSNKRIKLEKLDLYKSINDGWSKEELKKLLEGLIKHKGDWKKISELIGNKTPEQCILRFLKLPIEDKFLKNDINDNDESILKYAPYLPFNQADNPILSTLAFLTSLVEPELIQKTTENVIKIIDEQDIEKTLANELKENKEPPSLKEVSKIAFSIIGSKSHIFKRNEEIEMNKLTNIIVNTQLNKIDLKLKKLETVEENLVLEKKSIQQEKEELFLDRLSFAKLTNSIISKLDNLKDSSPDLIEGKISEIKELLSKNPRVEINSFNEFSKNLENDINTDSNISNNNEVEEEDDLKPISIETPQTYRYWSG